MEDLISVHFKEGGDIKEFGITSTFHIICTDAHSKNLFGQITYVWGHTQRVDELIFTLFKFV